MAQYELTVVLVPELGDDELPGAVERVKRIVTDKGGTVQSDEVLGRRRFAYTMKKKKDGAYVVARLDMPPHSVKEVEANLRLEERVVRHILIRR